MKDFSIEEIRAEGFARGKRIASWIDVPNLGERFRLDSCGTMFCEDADSANEIMQELAYEAESINRDYSPFEFTAHDLNEREDSEEAWESFQNGINEGIAAEIGKRVTDCAASGWFDSEGV